MTASSRVAVHGRGGPLRRRYRSGRAGHNHERRVNGHSRLGFGLKPNREPGSVIARGLVGVTIRYGVAWWYPRPGHRPGGYKIDARRAASTHRRSRQHACLSSERCHDKQPGRSLSTTARAAGTFRGPYAGPRVLPVIATLLVRRCCRCGSLIAWFLRCNRLRSSSRCTG